jgi:hypothetical protein
MGVGGRGENHKCRVFPLSLPLRTVTVDTASSFPKPPPGPNLIQRTYRRNFIQRGGAFEPATSSAGPRRVRFLHWLPVVTMGCTGTLFRFRFRPITAGLYLLS